MHDLAQACMVAGDEPVRLTPTALAQAGRVHPQTAEQILARNFGRRQLTPAEGEVRQDFGAIQTAAARALEVATAPATCAPGHHRFDEEYYGWRCAACGLFYPNTQPLEAWLNPDGE